jgi:hypothetical protein
MSSKEIKLAEIKAKRKQINEAKNSVCVEDLMKNIIYAITSLKQTMEVAGNIPDETVKMVATLISSMENKEVKINIPEKKILKSIVPVRDANGVAIKYDLEWWEE